MKKAFFHRINPFLLSFLMIISFCTHISIAKTSQTQDNNFFSNNLSLSEKDTLKNNFLSSSLNIADVLISNAQNDNISGVKWNKYFNYTGDLDSKYYSGYYYGAAGIGDYFTDLFNLTGNETYLNMGIQAFEYINSQAIYNGKLYDSIFTKPGFVIWPKAENNLNVYNGIKYGNAGISKFLFNLYLNTKNETVLGLALDSLNTLVYRAIDAAATYEPTYNGIYWGYSPNKNQAFETPIADYIYGNAGIASTFLTAYDITNNVTYLDTAKEAISWIISWSAVNDNTTSGERYIRFSPDPTYPFAFTGYLTGNSGIGDLLLQTYKITQNSDYLLFAKQLGNWLISKEQNGLWPTGGADLLTGDINEAGSFTGYGAGSSGIGMFLMHLYSISKDSKYLNPINQIINMFKNNANVTADNLFLTTKIDPNEAPIYQTDIKMGLAGDGLFFTELYHYFGTNESLIFLKGIFDFLESIKDSLGIIPTEFNNNYESYTRFDLSFLEGLTGIGFFFMNAFKSLNSSTLFNSNVLSNLDSVNSSIPGFEYLYFFVVSIILYLMKKKKKL